MPLGGWWGVALRDFGALSGGPRAEDLRIHGFPPGLQRTQGGEERRGLPTPPLHPGQGAPGGALSAVIVRAAHDRPCVARTSVVTCGQLRGTPPVGSCAWRLLKSVNR
eukprot:CAMPEP_0204256698 /NCGR_PEP_ID=MMETSP0468-20130131/3946_1 /ASSEMBLY_ACC=CAM_ASM_000383 /TAXON_ID=2969 /ORGANISM="Oxyrrhis marina" /LENGTH=107 /DNA_ID=CAMNT_0051230691 /DNA_START=58 /DNA_END=378 /DNA_ORIENTATION=-